MSAGLEAVGDAATGAIIARAVEPRHGEPDGPEHHGTCPNCQTHLVGAYCHACGQNSHIHRTLSGFGHDLLHGVFHFEGKIWATLPMLLFRPGELTRRYIAGERARFVSPMAMFLFCTFLFFSIVGGLAGEMHIPEISDVYKHQSSAQIKAALEKNKVARAALKAQIRAGTRAHQDTDVLEKKLDDIDNDSDAMRLALGFVSGGKEGERNTALGFKTGWPALDHGIENANKNPNLFFYRLQSSAYKYSWALIPLSTPLVWVLFFWKRKYKFYDHLVFVTFSITFMMLLTTILVVGAYAGVHVAIISLAAMIIPPIHMYRQLRGAYLCSRVGAFLRTWLLLTMSVIALTWYLVILLALGVLH